MATAAASAPCPESQLSAAARCSVAGSATITAASPRRRLTQRDAVGHSRTHRALRRVHSLATRPSSSAGAPLRACPHAPDWLPRLRRIGCPARPEYAIERADRSARLRSSSAVPVVAHWAGASTPPAQVLASTCATEPPTTRAPMGSTRATSAASTSQPPCGPPSLDGFRASALELVPTKSGASPRNAENASGEGLQKCEEPADPANFDSRIYLELITGGSRSITEPRRLLISRG